MPFLTIYTPTYKRPKHLARNKATVAAQTCTDFEHYIRVDDVGVGIDGMYQQLNEDVREFTGEYVCVLPDDDRLADEDAVADVKAFIESQPKPPPVVITRSFKAGLHLPKWGTKPEEGRIDLANPIVRRDIFIAYCPAYMSGRYQADFDFIRAVWDGGIPFTWCDRRFTESDIFMKGQPE